MKSNKFVNFFWQLGKAVRLRQWIKNFALYAGIIFSGQLVNPQSFWLVTQAFFLFCAASSTQLTKLLLPSCQS